MNIVLEDVEGEDTHSVSANTKFSRTTYTFTVYIHTRKLTYTYMLIKHDRHTHRKIYLLKTSITLTITLTAALSSEQNISPNKRK